MISRLGSETIRDALRAVGEILHKMGDGFEQAGRGESTLRSLGYHSIQASHEADMILATNPVPDYPPKN